MSPVAVMQFGELQCRRRGTVVQARPIDARPEPLRVRPGAGLKQAKEICVESTTEAVSVPGLLQLPPDPSGVEFRRCLASSAAAARFLWHLQQCHQPAAIVYGRRSVLAPPDADTGSPFVH